MMLRKMQMQVHIAVNTEIKVVISAFLLFPFQRLQLIADKLLDRFVTSGLMMKEWDRVKLHATVMNTLFRKDPNGEYF